MKRKVTLLAVLVIVLAILAGTTLAYFTDNEVAHNVITSGGIDIEIEEGQDTDGDGEPDQPWPEDGVEDVTPNQDISKIVSVTNLDSKSWIRVSVNVIIEKEVPVVDEETGEPVLDGDGNPVTETVELPLYLTETDADGNPIAAVTITGLNLGTGADQWTYGGDGYFYYNSPVAKDEETTALFTGVHFAKELGNEYTHCTANVHVNAEAVQADNNAIPEGGDVTDIEGWPAPETAYVGTPVDGDGKPIVGNN